MTDGGILFAFTGGIWSLVSKMFKYRHKAVICRTSALFAVFLARCTLGPEFIRPRAKVSPSWQDATNQRVNSGSIEYCNWWRLFNDPVLDQLVDRAYCENLSLKIAGVRILEARSQLGIAAGES